MVWRLFFDLQSQQGLPGSINYSLKSFLTRFAERCKLQVIIDTKYKEN